jgi:hypothetical protein
VSRGQYCYGFHDTPLPYDKARVACWERGGELVSVTSQEDRDFLITQDAILGFKGMYWMGYTDVKLEGESFTFTFAL